MTGLTVIATASRQESRDCASSLGADAVVDHSGDFAERPGGGAGRCRLHLLPLLEGQRGDLREGGQDLRADLRSVFRTADITARRDLLDRASQMFDPGDLRTTLTSELVGFTAENLRTAHQLVESGRTIGKVVVVREHHR